MSRRFDGSAIDRDMRYFSDGAREEYWTQIHCQPMSSNRSAMPAAVLPFDPVPAP